MHLLTERHSKINYLEYNLNDWNVLLIEILIFGFWDFRLIVGEVDYLNLSQLESALILRCTVNA
jgi:hypothetical protein